MTDAHTIGVIRGDGTGPEVVAEGLKVLDAVRDFDVTLVEFDLGADRFLRTGEVLPDEELARIAEMDAVFLGAVGDPRVRPGILERDLLLKIRFQLDQWVNLRPVVRYPGVATLVPSHSEDDVNFVVVRENSEGLYSGAGGFHRKGTAHEVAVQESINTRHGVERIVRYAFELAASPERRGRLTLVHKTNVLTFAGDLYQRVVDELATEFPGIETDYVHVDAACIYFLDSPGRFDVIVTDNMFGDIITDLGAMIQGGMGIAAGGNINPDGRLDVRADRRHRAQRDGQGHDQSARRDRRDGDAAAAAGRARGGREDRRGHPRGHEPDEEHARRRDGLHDRAGRRSRRGRCDRVSTEPAVRVELYDTTLRDGAQQADLSYTVEDRLRILHKLDAIGFPYIEGGWPGANPRDSEFFALATKETLQHAELTAFGMTRRAGERAEDAQALRDLLDAGTEVVCLVGKAWDLHVTEALRTDLAEGVAMVRDSVAFLRAQGRRVFFDAEHFFDGYRSDPAFAMQVVAAAEEAGAERLVLCDTNGGMLPFDIAEVVRSVGAQASVPLGIHVHNDAGCAVANSLVAVDAGVLQVQGTVNGYGERTGNADIVPISADLILKMGVTDALPEGSVAHLTELAHYVARDREPLARGAAAVRRSLRLHAQGGVAHERRRTRVARL